MGACSSKPKTTEYEDSMEPTEKSQVEILEANKVAEDAALKGSSERSFTQSLMGEGLSAKGTPNKVQDNEVQQKEAIVGAEEVQKERESMAVAVEGLLKEGILSSDEAVSASGSGEGKVGLGVAAEGEAWQVEAAIADEGETHENLQNASVTDKDVDVSGMQEYVKPLALNDGQSAELHSPDAAPVSGCTAAESTESADFVPSSTEEKVSEAPSVVQPAVSSGIAPTSDVKKVDISEKKETEPSSGLPSAAVPYLPEKSTIDAGQTIADEGWQGGSMVDPLPAATEEDGVSEESGEVSTLEDYIVAPPEAADNESASEPQAEAMTDASIVEKTSETYAEITAEESITKCTLQEETKSGESMVESQAGSETHAESIVELQPEVPTPDKGIAEDTAGVVITESFVKPRDETTADELIASIVSAQVQTTQEESLIDSAAMTTPDEAIAEPHAEIMTEESTAEPQVEASPADVKSENAGPEAVELSTDQVNNASSEDQLTFEDASDVPLKAESSTFEPQVPEEPSISENA